MDLPSLVSIIVPNFNHANHLIKRIDSILDQTYKNFEIIILDDCSTDHSRDIIEMYRSNPFVKKIIYNVRNSGSAFKQWQKGFEFATGEWIWIAESDDFADRQFLKTMLNSISTSTGNIGLAYCDSYIVDDDGVASLTFKSIKNGKHKTTRWSRSHENNGRNEMENWFLPDGTINNTSAVLFNKRFLKKANPFDIEFKYIGDKYTFMKIMAISDIVYVSDALNYYRNPINTKYSTKLADIFREQFLIFDWAFKIRLLPKTILLKFFLSSARLSLFRNWDKTKLSVFWNLASVNLALFLVAAIYNLLYPIFEHIGLLKIIIKEK